MAFKVLLRAYVVGAADVLADAGEPVAAFMAQHPELVFVEDPVLAEAAGVALDAFSEPWEPVAAVESALVGSAELAIR